jgi:outer membrane protein assembly factor BamB
VPLVWSDSKNLKWKTPLPGPGSSSAIVSGSRVFITCYSGYAINPESPGDTENLRRHLLCVDRSDGSVLWSKSIEPILPEDLCRGYIASHGYASNTPVTDGERVYVFFGKTGVLAFDFDGTQLWQVNVGGESSVKGWGSGASPILYKDLVIVNAAEESESIRAFDKMTGKEVWRAEAAGLQLSYGTPLVVELDADRQELVVAVPWELWGLNPDTGKLTWYAESNLEQNVAPSVVAENGIIYAFGGFTKASIAIRAGGKGDVTQTNVLWSSRYGSYVPSPVVLDGNLYWVNEEGIAHCADSETGEMVYRERLAQTGGSRGGRTFYASAVLAGKRLYYVGRTGGTFVLAAKPQFEQLARNQFASDDSDFHGSPAISDGQIFLRSNKYLYCIQDE